MRRPGNLVETLIMRAKKDPGNIAFSCLDDQCNVVYQLSNQQLHTRAAAIAGRLQQITSPPDRVLLLFPQGMEFIKAFMGVMYSGAIPVILAPPRDAQCDDARICYIQDMIEETGCNIVLTSTSILNEVMQYFFKSRVLSEKIILSVEEIDDDLMDRWSMPVIENRSVAYLQRTSTKTGVPKFVMTSHENMKNTHEHIKNNYKLTTSSRSVNWLPHYHYLGLVLGILQPLYCGYRGYIYSLFDFYKNPHGWLDAISKYKVTFSGAPDFAYRMCSEQVIDSQQKMLDLSGWNTAYNSGESVTKETADSFLKKFSCFGLKEAALTSIYGLAESVCVVSQNNYSKKFTTISRESIQPVPDMHVKKYQNNNENVSVVSCGPLDPDIPVAIVIPGTRTQCAESEPGEILVSNACSAIGYWNRPGETEKIFNVYLEGADDVPYLRTGDLGFIKEGEVHVIGKLEDHRPVVCSPVNISPDQLVNEKSAN